MTLSQYLLQHQLITQEALTRAQSVAIQRQESLWLYLSKQKMIIAEDLLQAARVIFQLPVVELSQYAVVKMPYQDIPVSLMEKYCLLAFKKNASQIYLAMIDPDNTSAIEAVKFHTGLAVEIFLASYDQLAEKIQMIRHQSHQDNLHHLAVQSDNVLAAKTLYVTQDESEPVVKFINAIIERAVQQQASDIHFEIYENVYRIRFRQDGILHEASKPPYHIATRLIARLKVMANLNIAECRLPQDGRFQLQLSSHQKIDIRVNSCPTLQGEKIVLRLLHDAVATRKIAQLGLTSPQEKLFKHAIFQPQGLILVTGPTGSGKTVTLYAALQAINSGEKNISTVEDPVEIQLPGINQVNVNTKINLNFAVALRAFLRQDPDVIMVGEIRDFETAEIALKAAQTGHLVLSTLHTNHALEAITRLHHMGIAPYHLTGSIILMTAQRLIRKLCPHCKIAIQLSSDLQRKLPLPKKIYQARGCQHCVSGYQNREAIHEVLLMNDEIALMLLQHKKPYEWRETLKNKGHLFLQDIALQKVSSGVTSLEEVRRVISCLSCD